MRRTLSREQEKNVCERYLKGESAVQLGGAYSVPGTTIWGVLHQHGVHKRSVNFLTKAQELEACKLYLGGMDSVQVSRALHVSDTIIRSALCRCGFKLQARRCNVDSTFFREIDTPAKSYWLGFIIADGCINSAGKFTLFLNSKDVSYIQKFNSALKSTYSICYYNKGRRDMVGVSISNKFFVLYLRRVFDRDKVVDMSEQLLHHFVRGLIDGDGSIIFTKVPYGNGERLSVTLAATESFLLSLSELLPFKVTTKIAKYTSDLGSVCFSYLYSAKAMEFLRWIYSGSTESIRLDRKYERYLKALDLFQVKKPGDLT